MLEGHLHPSYSINVQPKVNKLSYSGHGGRIITKTFNYQFIALSYTALRRYQHDLASFSSLHNQDRVELPTHFDPGQFTSGAIENWDH